MRDSFFVYFFMEILATVHCGYSYSGSHCSSGCPFRPLQLAALSILRKTAFDCKFERIIFILSVLSQKIAEGAINKE